MGVFWSLKLLPMVPNVTFSGYVPNSEQPDTSSLLTLHNFDRC
jgi:hypothetical protein